MAYYDTLKRSGINTKKKQLRLTWSFKRKRYEDGSLAKYKERLCCHGSQQQWGVNYYETYAPVVSWPAVRTTMTMLELYNLHTQAIDFVLAYPQADVKAPIYLLPPAGVEINTNGEDLVLILRKNLYELKDAGRTWWDHLSEGLERLGFKPCNSDQCVWRKEGVVIIVYVDDCCIFANGKHEADKVVKVMDGKFDITDEGETIEEYLEVKVDHNGGRSFRMYQPHFLSRIIEAIPGMDKAKLHTTPTNPTFQVNKDIDEQERNESWNYRSAMGMLYFLVKSTHLELAHSAQQCARFCKTPKASHRRAKVWP
eukprot:3018413-Ditylum_brightwellii.AAC.1